MATNNIQNELLKDVKNSFDKSEGGFVYDILKTIAIQLNKYDEKNAMIFKKMDVENLTSEEITRFVYQRSGLIRKPATYAETVVTISGNNGAIVNAGDLVACNEVFYQVVEGATIDQTGIASVLVRCLQPGTIGNVPANQINGFPVTLTGITSVTNENAVTNGYEQESDRALIDRYYDKLQKPGKAGNVYHYQEWARSVVGVGKVKVFPRWAGVLSVKVSILDENLGVADPELIKNVQDYIESEQPFGVNLTVTTGAELPVNISTKLTLEQNFILDDVTNQISEKIKAYLKNLSYVAEYVSIAQIGKEILSVPGVLDYSNLTINETVENIQLDAESVPVLGDTTWL